MAETTFSDSSTNKLTVQNVEFKWKIADFPSRAGSGTSITSPTFPSSRKNGPMWFMICTFKKDRATPIEICLNMHKPYPNPKTDFSSFTLFADEMQSNKPAPRPFEPEVYNCITVDASQIKKDVITIVAKLQVYTSPYNTNAHMDVVKVPKRNLGVKLCKLLSSAAFSDVVLLADGIEFPAHQNILAAQSPVFGVMFNQDMMETKTNKVEIEDISAEVLEGMLHFIYSDEAPPKLDEMSEEMILVAEKYDLPRLKAMCEQNLAAKLSVENALETWLLADKLSADQLKKAALEIIKHGDAITGTPKFKKIITSRSTLPNELLSKIFNWK